MSKKLKNKGILPPSVSGKVFSSFNDLGSALGFKAAEQPTPKAMKCRKCGAIMRNIPGTNIWVCDAMVEKGEGDKKKMEICGNRAMTSVRSASQSFENPGDFKPKQKNYGKPAQTATV